MIELSEPPKTPVALSIGNFDGVHLGHQEIIRRLKKTGSPAAIVTFEPHPLQVLKPDAPRPLQITSYEQKKALLKQFGVDYLVTIAFTKEFAQITYDQFLDSLSLTHLIQGQGDAFGHKREGTEAKVRAWAMGKPIQIEYIPKITLDNEPVSSSRIRKALLSQDWALAERLLGYTLKELHV